jgi:DNA polymerase-3 subunit epsilon
MATFEPFFKSFNEGATFVAFDLETTGLDPRVDRIVEIGAIKFDRKGLIARFSALVNPGIPMPVEASRVNNITDEMLAGKPSIEKVLPDFLLFIQKAILLAHNAPFDSGFINERLKSGPEPFPSLPNSVIDSLILAREKFPALRSHSLQNLAKELKIEVKDAHRAEDDAMICMDIFLRCIE